VNCTTSDSDTSPSASGARSVPVSFTGSLSPSAIRNSPVLEARSSEPSRGLTLSAPM